MARDHIHGIYLLRGVTMSEELQTDGAGAESGQDLETVATGTVTDGAELAAATGENQEQKTEGFNQEAANKAINKKHFQYKEEERQRKATEAENKRLQSELETLKQGEAPVVPDIPDPFSDNYEDQIKARDEALMRKAAYDKQQEFVANQQANAQKQTEEAEQKRFDGLVSGFNSNAVKLGLDAQEVERAGNTVAQYGISADVASYILEDSEGPLIAKFLAANPLEIESLNTLSPMQAAIKLNNEIRTKAASLKPQISNAPDPADILSGGGVPEGQSPLLSGATFE